MAQRLTQAEAALQIAETAIHEVTWFLENEPWPEEPNLQEFYRTLLARDSDTINSDHRGFTIPTGPLTAHAIAILNAQPLLRPPTELRSLTLFFEPGSFGPLPSPGTAGGLRPDSREKEGVLRIEAIARCGQVTKCLNVLRRVKVVNIVHPVLAKFSLFLRTPPLDTSKINILHQDAVLASTARGKNFRTPDGREASPIVLYNGVIRPLCPPRAPMQFPSLADVSQVASNALIFLGGGNWEVHLGGGPPQNLYSERHLVRLFRHPVPGVLATPLPGTTLDPDHGIDALYYESIGMADDFIFLKHPGPPPQVEVKPLESIQAYLHGCLPHRPGAQIKDFKGTFPIRLFGTASLFSPAVVIGDVDRIYQRWMTMTCRVKGGPPRDRTLSFVPETLFLSGTVFELAQEARTKSLEEMGLERYTLGCTGLVLGLANRQPAPGFYARFQSQFMTTLIKESINRTWDFVFTNPATGTLEQPVLPTAGTYPVVPEEGVAQARLFEALAARGIQPSPPPYSGEKSWSGKKFVLTESDGRVVFSGDLNSLLFLPELIAKTVIYAPTWTDFLDRYVTWVKDSSDRVTRAEIRIPGVCYIGQPIRFDLPPRAAPEFCWLIRRGGILISAGDITIAESLQYTGPHPLTLATPGTIRIRTARPIYAHLIALGKPSIVKDLPESGFKLAGSIGAHQLDFTNLTTGPVASEIMYDPIVAPQNPRPEEPYFPLRFYLSDEKRVFFGKKGGEE